MRKASLTKANVREQDISICSDLYNFEVYFYDSFTKEMLRTKKYSGIL